MKNDFKRLISYLKQFILKIMDDKIDKTEDIKGFHYEPDESDAFDYAMNNPGTVVFFDEEI